MQNAWKKIIPLGILVLLLLCTLCFLSSCSADLAPVQATAEAETKEVKTEEQAEPLPKPHRVYRCDNGDVLSSYRVKNEKAFESEAKNFEKEGYTLYSESEIGGNLAKTYVKDSSLAHLY